MCIAEWVSMGQEEDDNSYLSYMQMQEQKKAAEQVKAETQAAKAATPKAGKSANISSDEAMVQHKRGVASTYLASKLAKQESGNNLGA